MEIKESTDFDLISHSYFNDFPVCEQVCEKDIKRMLSEGKYKLLLFIENGEIVSYILAYCENSDLLWMDYFATFKQFRGQGFGKLSLKTLIQTYPQYSVLFEVEHENEDVNSQESKRVRFYLACGAKKLSVDYKLPTPDGSLPMGLYVLTNKDTNTLKLKDFVFNAVMYIHSDLPHTKQVILDYIDQLN